MPFSPKSTDFIDIHTHRAEGEPGVFRIRNIFTSDFPVIPGDRPISIGLHPWHISSQSVLEMDGVFESARVLPNFLAIGEAGLDNIVKISPDQQVEVFRRQIEFSRKFNKPLIIHCVKAFPELFRIKKLYPDTPSWILHGFNASPEIAAECVKLGIYISLSARLLKNHEKAVKVMNALPVSMIFAETDDDPTGIEVIYNAIAKAYALSREEIRMSVLENFRRVFACD